MSTDNIFNAGEPAQQQEPEQAQPDHNPAPEPAPDAAREAQAETGTTGRNNAARGIFGNIRSWFNGFGRHYHCPYCFAPVNRHMRRPLQQRGLREDLFAYHCAECETDLPHDFFSSHSTSIAVVGGTQAGKSSFITIFCELLLYRSSALDELGIYGSIINAEGRQQFEDNRSMLIRQELTLDSTSEVQSPIVVRLHSKHHKKVTYITLMDSPGEHFGHIDELVARHPNLHHARGIVFLMNPLDIGELLLLIRKANPGTISPRQEMSNRNFEIIETLYQFYLRTRRIRPNRKIKVSTAFCLSRADLLEEAANLYIPPDYEPDMEDVQEILEEVQLVTADLQELLQETDKKLLNIITKQYQNYALFPVSPLGKSPRADGLGLRVEGGVEPKGVLQPIIWILYQTKFIARS